MAPTSRGIDIPAVVRAASDEWCAQNGSPGMDRTGRVARVTHFPFPNGSCRRSPRRMTERCNVRRGVAHRRPFPWGVCRPQSVTWPVHRVSPGSERSRLFHVGSSPATGRWPSPRAAGSGQMVQPPPRTSDTCSHRQESCGYSRWSAVHRETEPSVWGTGFQRVDRRVEGLHDSFFNRWPGTG